MMKRFVERAVAAGLASFLVWTSTSRAGASVPDRDVQRITEAAPARATARPKRRRRMLVFNLCRGFRHKSIPWAAKAMEILGQKSGAFETVMSTDPAVFAPESLRQFDAVCMNNTTRELFDKAPNKEELKRSLMDFVRGGKGIVGIHAATDCFYKWPEYGEMMGGYFSGHPWRAGDTVTIKIDEPDHPLNAGFKGQGFEIKEEMYQFKEPYSREQLRVILSIDTEKTNMKKGIKRKDGDFAVSWLRDWGQGRVFYCSLGHNNPIFWHPAILQHYLDGIQYAMGDLEADARPSAAAGKSAGGAKQIEGVWKGRVENGASGHELTITADRIAGRKDGRRDLGEGSYKLDTTATPWTLDATGTKGQHKDEDFLGICSVNGDVLRWCVTGRGGKRPSEFSTGGGRFLLVLKRQ
ncbi:MAG: ThuA domain-containing protein [Planctomycetota bacterium]|jgi:uncharacterized protein (TIGR03067 family)